MIALEEGKAGLPESVVKRAREVLSDLEGGGKVQKPGRVTERAERVQLSFFEADVHPVVEALRGIDVEAMTPLEALTKLADLQKLVKG